MSVGELKAIIEQHEERIKKFSDEIDGDHASIAGLDSDNEIDKEFYTGNIVNLEQQIHVQNRHLATALHMTLGHIIETL